jgi:hypothetical protein
MRQGRREDLAREADQQAARKERSNKTKRGGADLIAPVIDTVWSGHSHNHAITPIVVVSNK